MLKTVYIDNNVWERLFRLELDPCVELPPSEWCICVSREVEMEMENQRTPTEVRAFFRSAIERCGHVRSYFGFSEWGDEPGVRRVGGFGELGSPEAGGYFAEYEEVAFMEKYPLNRDKRNRLPLHNNEADRSLASRAFRFIVLTLDKKRGGPLLAASNQGLKVIFLTDFDKQKESLSAFIKRNLATKPE